MNTVSRIENLRYILRTLLAEREEYAGWRIPDALETQQSMMRALLNVRPPQPVSPEFLQAQDAELRQQLADKGIGQQASGMAGRYNPVTSGRYSQCRQQRSIRLFRAYAPLYRQRHPFGGRRTVASGVRQTDAGARASGTYRVVRQDNQRL